MKLKKWLLQIQITLPRKIPDENIEIIKDGDDRIFLGRNKIPGRDEKEHVLHSISSVDDPMKFLEHMGDKIELILDGLAFQLQGPIPTKYVEVIDVTDPVEVGEERDIIAANSYPRIQKDTELDFVEMWHTSINTKITNEELDDDIVSALRWFSKGISTKIVVDQFTSFWIALEILTRPSKPTEREIVRCRGCGREVDPCPECGFIPKFRPDTRTRIEKYVVDKLEVDRKVLGEVWDLRQLFHGDNTLKSEDLHGIIDATAHVKKWVIANLKMRLGLTEQDEPRLMMEAPLQIGGMFVKGTRKLHDADIENLRKHILN